ncbi:MAG: hypothetical protein NZ455_05690 [Bacteroidia bacterium]|nr:hypothetical protein [Bacteroidia bacterium]
MFYLVFALFSVTYKVKRSIEGLRYLQNVLREACGGCVSSA